MGILLMGVLAMAGFTFGIVGLLVALYAIIEVKALQKSTHQVQYVDAFQDKDHNLHTDENGFQELDDQTRDKLEKEDDLFGDETKNPHIQY